MKQLLERKHGTRTIMFALLLTMLAWLAPMNVGVAKAAEDDMTISLDVDGGCLIFDKETGSITGYEGNIKDVTIPAETPDGDKITSIGFRAFYACGSLASVDIQGGVTTIGVEAFGVCRDLTSVSIQNGVTTIGEGAFDLCSSLTGVSIPDSVKTIGKNSFHACSSLSSVNIPDSIKTIEGGVFNACSGLTSVSIPDSVTTIGWGAFAGCSKLTGVSIPDSVTTIGRDAFWDCSSLSSVKIPDSVTSIGVGAFCHSGLTKVEIPGSVTSIGWGAFSGCSGLSSVSIPNSITTIENEVFSGCSGLTSVSIPNSVTTIERAAFKGCSNLSSVSISNSIKTIEREVFSSCSSLTSVSIPGSVTTIGEQAFSACSSLTSVSIPDSVTSIGERAFNHSGLTKVEIPGSVKTIERETFYSCSKLTSVSISNGVTSIGYQAFSDCSNLSSVEIPGSVTTIGVLAFYGCSKLSNVSIQKGVTTIGSAAFADCSGLSSMSIPGSVTTIEQAAFEGCSGLSSVAIQKGVKTIEGYAFADCSGLSSVEIPDSVKTIEFRAFAGCSGLTSVSIPGSVETIETSVFSSCSSLSSVAIQKGVKTIEDYAFNGCTSLTSVSIPDSIETIENDAFYGCKASLTSIDVDAGNQNYSSQDGALFDKVKETLIQYPIGNKRASYEIPDGVKTIGGSAFSDCTSLTSVSIPDSVETIGGGAFQRCSGLTSVSIPSGVKTIGYGIFSGCSGLTSVSIPDSVTSIGQWAFSACGGLTSVTIPSSVTSIEYSAFRDCNGLISVTIPNSVTTIGESAFGYQWGKDGDLKVPGFKIYGYSNDSAAAKYAKENGFEYILVDAENPDDGLFDKENESTEEVVTPPEAADIPEGDRITSITINPAFNMKNKNDKNVELDLSKIKIKASAIYDEEGLKRAEAALGKVLKGNKHYNLLDLTLLYDGKDFSNGYEGLVKVTIPLPKGHRDKTFSCYRITEAGDKELIPGEQTEDSYIIYLEHFSEYALVASAELEEEHTHNYSTDWKSDVTGHWKECATCRDKTEESIHMQDAGTVTKEATKTEPGIKTYKCSICGYVIKTEQIEMLSAGKDSVNQNTSAAAKITKAQKKKNGIILNKKASSKISGNALTVTWNKLKDADGYDIYAASCDDNFKKVTLSVGKNKTSAAIRKINGKKIDKKKPYKVEVKAYRLLPNGKKQYLGVSATMHLVGNQNKTTTNAKNISFKKKAYVLKKGKSAQIHADIIKADKKKRLLSRDHGARLSYVSSNDAIATVTAAGKIKAKKRGKCTIYVRALNGISKQIKVTVK